MNYLKVKQATIKGYDEAYEYDGLDLQYPSSLTRRGRVKHQMSHSIQSMGVLHLVDKNLKIRRLSALETWRLMGFDDEDYYKARSVNEDKKLYQQSGNSIVVNVLEEIFKQLF